jgi:hypothetical protein
LIKQPNNLTPSPNSSGKDLGNQKRKMSCPKRNPNRENKNRETHNTNIQTKETREGAAQFTSLEYKQQQKYGGPYVERKKKDILGPKVKKEKLKYSRTENPQNGVSYIIFFLFPFCSKNGKKTSDIRIGKTMNANSYCLGILNNSGFSQTLPTRRLSQ